MNTKLHLPAEEEVIYPHTCPGYGVPTRARRIRRALFFGGLAIIGLAIVSCVFPRVIIGPHFFFLSANKTYKHQEWPIPSNISLSTCDTWTKHPGWYWQRSSAEATFSLPINVDTLLVLSRGSDQGRIRLVDGYDGENAKVEVRATYGRGLVLEDHIRICTITRGEGETGMGFFTQAGISPEVSYEATIHLPTSGRTTPLRIPKLETDLIAPDLWISFGSGMVEFDDVVLKSDTTSGTRALGSIRTKRARLSVDEHSVTGNIQVKSNFSHEYHLQNGPSAYAQFKLSVESPSGGSVADEVGLNNTFAQTLRLGNQPPQPDSSLAPGPFRFEISSPQILELDIAHSVPHFPCSPHWTFQPCTSDLDITPPVTFGGTFDVISSAGPAELHFDGKVDPTGTGRARRVEVSGVGEEEMRGSVGWEDEMFDVVRFEVDTNLHTSVFLR